MRRATASLRPNSFWGVDSRLHTSSKGSGDSGLCPLGWPLLCSEAGGSGRCLSPQHTKLRTFLQHSGPWRSVAPAAAPQPPSSPILQVADYLGSECSLFSCSALSGQPLQERGRFGYLRANLSTEEISLCYAEIEEI